MSIFVRSLSVACGVPIYPERSNINPKRQVFNYSCTTTDATTDVSIQNLTVFTAGLRLPGLLDLHVAFYLVMNHYQTT